MKTFMESKQFTVLEFYKCSYFAEHSMKLWVQSWWKIVDNAEPGAEH
jgi:hypothetical protein